jgi:hypothetical protein
MAIEQAPYPNNALEARQPLNEPERLFLERARKSAQLLKTSLTYCKADAVDALWRYAEDHHIVDKIGTDRTQAILAEAFR